MSYPKEGVKLYQLFIRSNILNWISTSWNCFTLFFCKARSTFSDFFLDQQEGKILIIQQSFVPACGISSSHFHSRQRTSVWPWKVAKIFGIQLVFASAEMGIIFFFDSYQIPSLTAQEDNVFVGKMWTIVIVPVEWNPYRYCWKSEYDWAITHLTACGLLLVAGLWVDQCCTFWFVPNMK